MRTDVYELVHQCTAADDGEIIYFHFAGQLRGVGHDDIVVQDAVVRHMAVSHDEVVVTDDGLSFAGSTAVDRDELTHDVVVTDDGPGLFAVELQVLRYSTDDGGGEDVAVLAHFDVTADGGAGIDDATVTYLYVAVDGHERTYLYILANFGFGMNTC